MVWKQNGINRNNSGLVISEHSRIEFSNDNTNYIQIVIFQNGFPVLIGYGLHGKASLLLSRQGMSLKGSAKIDVRAYTKSGSEQKLTGLVTIV